MKKTVVLIAFLFVMSAALIAVQASNVTSYDPNRRIDNPTQSVLDQMLHRAKLGQATRAELATIESARHRIGDRIDVSRSMSRNTYLDENFDGLTALPEGWSTEGESGANWGIDDSNNAGGDAPELYFDWSPAAVGTGRVISPEMNTTGATEVYVSFNHYVNYYSYWDDPYVIGVATSSDGVTWNSIYEIMPEAVIPATPMIFLVDNADVGSSTFQISFYFVGDSYDINYWYIDNILVEDPPTGPQLSAGFVDPATGNNLYPFEFAINYVNPDGLAPTIHKVYVNGTPYDMVAPATPDYAAGAVFTYSMPLPLGTAHEYYFHFSDGAEEAYLPDTAPTTPYYGPEVYNPITAGTLTIDAAGGGDYTTFQACFDDLAMHGIAGAVDVEVAAGTYVEEATLSGNVHGASSSQMVHFYPVGGEVVVDGSAHTSDAPIYILNSGNVWFEDFTMINGVQGGFRTSGTDNAWISNSRLYLPGWVGIGFSESQNCRAWNNMISWATTQGIALYDGGVGSNHLIWNNSVYAETPDDQGYIICLTFSNSEAVVYNNIFHRNYTADNFEIVHIQNQDWTSHPNSMSDYNCFYTEDGCDLITGYATLADWQATGFGMDMNSVEGNPYFDDVAAYDLHITGVTAGSSAAYHGGTNVNAWFTDDFDGDIRTTPWDIGADMIVPPASPQLTVGALTPETGNQWTVFEWTVNYWHPLGNAPTSVKVIIDGNSFSPHTMTLISGDPGDGVYCYTQTMAEGNHDYYFTAATDMGSLRFPETGSLAGPQVTFLTVTSVPYTQDFEGGALPAEWSQEYQTVNNVDWIYTNGGTSGNPSAAYEGSFNAQFYDTDGDQTYLVTPLFDLTTITDPILSFWHTQPIWSSDQDVLTLWYKNDPNGDWIQFAQWTESIVNWTNEVITLPNPTGTYWIAFDGLGDYGYGVCIDYVQVMSPPQYTVEIPTAPQSGSALPGNYAMYPVEITNVGVLADTYDLVAEDYAWDTTFWNTPDGSRRSQITNTGEVLVGETVTVYVKVTVDGAAVAGETDTATIKAISQGDASRYASTSVTTEALASFDMISSIDATMKNGCEGIVVEYIVKIENIGGANDTYDLTLEEDDWPTVWADGASVSVNANQVHNAIIQVTCDGVVGETDTTMVTVTSQGDPAITNTYQIITGIIGTEGNGVGFYYTWKNKYATNGPTYNWYSPVTRAILDPMPDDDGCVGPFPLGFDFPFYGDMVNQFYVNSNGMIDFYAPDSSFSGQNIPSTTVPNGLVALYWDDLNPTDTPLEGTPAIYQEAAFIDGKNAHVITYDHMPEYDSDEKGYFITAQIILFEDGCVKMQYKEFYPGFDMDYAAIGLENADGTDAVLYSYHNYSVWNEMAVMFYYEPIEYNVSIDNTTMTLSWDAVTGADTYNVYGCDDPYGVYPDDYVLVTNTADLFYVITPEPMKFYVITAQAPEVVRLRNREEEIQQAQKAEK